MTTYTQRTWQPPLVSVGIPFYNNEHTLGEAVRSVLNQSYNSFELLLLDDGSTDGSLDIAFGFSDERIRVISDGQNLGLPARLNQLTREARGEYIARMDADDIMVATRLSKQVNFLLDSPNIDVVASAAYLMDEHSLPFGVFELGPLPQTLPGVLRQGGLWAHPTITGKRDWFSANPYNTSATYRKAQDLELWCRTIQNSHFAKIPEPLLFYRVAHNGDPRKYWATGTVERLILRTYGTPVLNAPYLNYLMLRSWARTLRIIVSQALGLRKHAAGAKRRFHSESQRTKAQTELREALTEH